MIPLQIYNRHEAGLFRHPKDRAELLKHITHVSSTWFLALDGTARIAKVLSIKTWKRRDDVVVSIKYGLCEFAKFDLIESLSRLLIRVDPN